MKRSSKYTVALMTVLLAGLTTTASAEVTVAESHANYAGGYMFKKSTSS